MQLLNENSVRTIGKWMGTHTRGKRSGDIMQFPTFPIYCEPEYILQNNFIDELNCKSINLCYTISISLEFQI